MSEADVRFLRLPVTLFTLVLVGWLLERGAFLFLPLTVALLLCLVLLPIVTRLEQRKVPPAVTITAVLLLVAGLLTWVGGVVLDNARELVKSVRVEDLLRARQDAGGGLGELGRVLAEELKGVDWRNLDPETVADLIKRVVPRLAGVLAATATMLQGVVTQVFLVLLFMAFLFAERASLRRKLDLLAGSRNGRMGRLLGRAMGDVQQYLVVKTGVSLATGLVCWVGMLAIGVPYAAVFALLTFLLNYIPNIGSTLAAVFPVIAAWALGGSLGDALWTALLYLAANVAFGSVLEPRLLGRSLNLSPLVVLAALLFWGALWGIAGMFLAIPLTRTFQLIALHLPDLRWIGLLLSNDPEAALARLEAPEPDRAPRSAVEGGPVESG